MSDSLGDRILAKVREMPDFPKPGLVFRDITRIMTDADLFREVVDTLADRFGGEPPDLVCGVEARGYIFGAALAYRMGLGFLPIRWEGKLPPDRLTADFELEYGFDALEVHGGDLEGGRRVLIVDDLLGTGKTIEKCCELVVKAGGKIQAIAVVVEVESLRGRARFEETDLVALSKLGE
ncbi:MAG: adenine phosphoribosyltransferase [Planctomycetota bacterium]